MADLILSSVLLNNEHSRNNTMADLIQAVKQGESSPPISSNCVAVKSSNNNIINNNFANSKSKNKNGNIETNDLINKNVGSTGPIDITFRNKYINDEHVAMADLVRNLINKDDDLNNIDNKKNYGTIKGKNSKINSDAISNSLILC